MTARAPPWGTHTHQFKELVFSRMREVLSQFRVRSRTRELEEGASRPCCLSESPQAIDRRCTENTARCLRRLVEEGVQEVVAADEALPVLLQRFTAVCAQDGTALFHAHGERLDLARFLRQSGARLRCNLGSQPDLPCRSGANDRVDRAHFGPHRSRQQTCETSQRTPVAGESNDLRLYDLQAN